MQAINLKYLDAFWAAVTMKMENWHCGNIADHDLNLIHAYQKSIMKTKESEWEACIASLFVMFTAVGLLCLVRVSLL